MTDAELIHNYLQNNDQSAFSKLVEKHVDMVYASALRRSRDCAVAEDITQAVFILLLRKVRSLRKYTSIAGWLMQATHFTTLSHQRQQMRRRKHEQAAAAQAPELLNDPESIWQTIQPNLDHAILRLSESDRDVVTLRFFHSKSYMEVGQQLGISEDTARKRVERALERLRGYLSHDGRLILPSAILAAVDYHAMIHAPAHLLTISASTSSTLLAKGALAIMTAKKTATVAGILIGATLVGGTTIVATKYITSQTREVHVQIPPGGTVNVITIGGSVKSPGAYAINPDNSGLKRFIESAGGATIEKGFIQIRQRFNPAGGTISFRQSPASPNSAAITGTQFTESLAKQGISTGQIKEGQAVTADTIIINGQIANTSPTGQKQTDNLRQIGQAMIQYSPQQPGTMIQIVSLEDLISGKIPDIQLQAGDQITLSSEITAPISLNSTATNQFVSQVVSNTYYLGGLIEKPGAYSLPGKPLSIKDAIEMAGAKSLNPDTYIEIVHLPDASSMMDNAKVTNHQYLLYSDILAGKHENLYLSPGDQVRVGVAKPPAN